MELNPAKFDAVLGRFHGVWSPQRVAEMTLEEYSNLQDTNSFCYWLEYGSNALGAIGDIPLTKFEIWKPGEQKQFKDSRFLTDGTYAWKQTLGNKAAEAFDKIKPLLLQIILKSQEQDWQAIDNIEFHSIARWKIASLYSGKTLLPVYSRRALLAIATGLEPSFNENSKISVIQRFILSNKTEDEHIAAFAARLYLQFADKIKPGKYYIIGSSYGNGRDVPFRSVMPEFLKHNCVAFGFLSAIDFSDYMDEDAENVNEFVDLNWQSETSGTTTKSGVKGYFRILSRIKEGDIIAVKSIGVHNQLTIIAYAIVCTMSGKVYSHHPDLGQSINVEFVDSGFSKKLGLTYPGTIHHLTPKKDKEKFYKIFGWYAAGAEVESKWKKGTKKNITITGDYNKKNEIPLQRSTTGIIIVNQFHNKIQNRFIEYLQSEYGDEYNTGEKSRMDAIRENEKEFFIYEIKPYESVYRCVREGIGQLLDYYHSYKTDKTKYLRIVGPNFPEVTDIEFIRTLKNTLGLPVSYIAFDEQGFNSKEFE